MHLPTSISFLSTSLMLMLLLSATTSALPSRGRGKGKNENRGPQNNNRLTACPLKPTPSLPPSSLPAVGAGLELKYVVLGRGTQNYTCSNATSPPAAAGAVATLYDISCLVNTPQSRLQLTNYITPNLLGMPPGQIESFLYSRIPDAVAGSHFFRDGTTPIFALGTGDSVASGKVAGCPAPPEARGNENGAAVDWLKLARKPAEAMAGIEEVYRVGTAGGRAPATCAQPGGMTVDYVAEYWMYG